MNDIEKLELFRAKAEELRLTRYVQKGYAPKLTIKSNKLTGVDFSVSEPDEEDLRSFLITFRQFISSSEPIFLYRIYNICQKTITSDELRNTLAESRIVWKSSMKSNGIMINYQGKILTPEYITDLWVNGYYFHSDSNKRSVLMNLFPHESTLLRHQFLDFLANATTQVLYTAKVITIAIRDGLINT